MAHTDRQKVQQEHDSSEKLVRFSNLYTRLLSQPVLSQKWGILSLLHELANSGAEGGIGDEGAGLSDDDVNGDPGKAHEPDDETFRDAFAGAGLPQLPSQQRQTRSTVLGQASRSGNRQQDERNGIDTTKAMENPDRGPSEAALLRDLPFILQGLSTTNLSFSSSNTLDLPPNLPLPIISILHSLAEPSLLYRALSDFVQSSDEGLVGQSLRSAIGNELRSYLSLISTLESEIRQAIKSSDTGTYQGRGRGKGGVTLTRCVIWTREATLGLRLMSLMVDEAKSKVSSAEYGIRAYFSKTERAGN